MALDADRASLKLKNYTYSSVHKKNPYMNDVLISAFVHTLKEIFSKTRFSLFSILQCTWIPVHRELGLLPARLH